jgi:hypothetical protein
VGCHPAKETISTSTENFLILTGWSPVHMGFHPAKEKHKFTSLTRLSSHQAPRNPSLEEVQDFGLFVYIPISSI